jgi:hypothetical protein
MLVGLGFVIGLTALIAIARALSSLNESAETLVAIVLAERIRRTRIEDRKVSEAAGLFTARCGAGASRLSHARRILQHSV